MDLILWRHAEAEDRPASSEQGSLWDANVREPGPLPSGPKVVVVESSESRQWT